jgi:S-formylglutathione hydrolase FrmB
MLDLAQQMVAILDQSGYQTTTTFTPGGHNYQYWLSNMPAYWQWAAEDWQ